MALGDRQTINYYSRTLCWGITLLVLFLCLWATKRQWELSALPPDSTLTTNSFPVQVGGRTAASLEELSFIVQATPIGETLEINGQDQTHQVTLIASVSTFYRILIVINGFFFWIVALWVFAPRMDKVPARDLYWACLLYGLTIMVGDIHFPLGGVGPTVLLPALRLGSLVLLPSLLLSVGLTFPQRSKLLARVPRLIPGIFITGLALALLHFMTLLLYFYHSTPTNWALAFWPSIAVKLFLVTAFAAGCLTFYQTHRHAVRVREKKQARWILWGITIGAAPYVLFYALPSIWGQPLIPIEVARLFSLVIPVAFSFTEIWFQFLDIDVIIRRSLIYALLAGVMVGIYLALGVLVRRELERTVPSISSIMPILATLVPVLLFHPTRKFLGRWVDRMFFNIRYDYVQALREYQRRIAGVSTQQQLANALRNFLQDNLSPKVIATVLRYHDRDDWVGSLPPSLIHAAIPSFDPIIQDNRPIMAANSSSMPELEQLQLPQPYFDAGIRIVHPLKIDKQLEGLVLLGEKTVERLYINRDLELIATAVDETARCLERMNLAQDFAKQAVERSRLDEMQQLKTEFFSRVAHDLRSPLTSISWSARNLLDGITGDLNSQQHEYMEGIENSSKQLLRLVNNLLEINRLEKTEVQIDPIAVDLPRVLRQAVRELSPVAQGKEVRLVVIEEDDVGPIRGDPQKLLEVVENLVENAIRYSPPGTDVEIHLTPGDEGQQLLKVRDHGPGVTEQDLDSIFNSFQQGTPSPYSAQQGFGVGLHVVKTYVDLMGGSVSIENHKDGGASFECVFEEWHQPEVKSSSL